METINKAKIAESIAKEIFKYFFWEVCGPTNNDFPCLSPKEENVDKCHSVTKSHPVDGVYYYIEPYSGKTIYINTDFKNYAAASITPQKIRGSLVSLAETIACARRSDEWKSLMSCQETHNIVGMLFIYNSNYDYTHDRHFILNKVDTSNLPLEKGQTIHLLDPLTINYIYNIARDLKELERDGFLYTFFYPNKEQFTNTQPIDFEHPTACTIEHLCSGFILLKYIKHNKNEGYLVYYNELGKSPEEFLFLLDYLTKIQIPLNNTLKIKMTQSEADSKAMSYFETAKKNYMAYHPCLHQIIADGIRELSLEFLDDIKPNFIKGIKGWGELE
ncbi:hypothetical protein NMU81_01070 [Pasteurella multocida]|nr:hypothetical protein [Pasteurella multocida]